MENKINLEDASGLLSNILDIQDFVLESTMELTGKKISYLTELFIKSKTHERLFDITSGYYKQDIGFIIEDFLREVMDQVGVKFIQQEGDSN